MENTTENDDALWREVFKRRFDAMEAQVAKIEENTSELVEIMQAWKGTMKVMGWVTRPVTVVLTFVAAAAGAYTAWPRK